MLCNQSAVCWAILDLSKEGPLGRPALGAKGELQADLPLMGEGACSSPFSLGPVFLVPKVELGTSLPRHAQGFNICNLGLCHLLAWNLPLVPAVLAKPSSPLWLGRPLSPLCSQLSPIPQMLQAPSSLRAFARAVFGLLVCAPLSSSQGSLLLLISNSSKRRCLTTQRGHPPTKPKSLPVTLSYSLLLIAFDSPCSP